MSKRMSLTATQTKRVTTGVQALWESATAYNVKGQHTERDARDYFAHADLVRESVSSSREADTVARCVWVYMSAVAGGSGAFADVDTEGYALRYDGMSVKPAALRLAWRSGRAFAVHGIDPLAVVYSDDKGSVSALSALVSLSGANNGTVGAAIDADHGPDSGVTLMSALSAFTAAKRAPKPAATDETPDPEDETDETPTDETPETPAFDIDALTVTLFGAVQSATGSDLDALADLLRGALAATEERQGVREPVAA